MTVDHSPEFSKRKVTPGITNTAQAASERIAISLAQPSSRRNFTRLAMAVGAAAIVPPALAQTGPRIRLVIPFSAGATSDLLARPIMQALERELGQTIVIDNKPGVGGLTGAAEVARAAPDGLTLAWGTVSNHAIAPSLYPNPPYDPLRDFSPIALLCSVPHVVMVHPSVPAQNLAQLVELLRTQPGRWDYASSGNGTISHLIAEAFKAAVSGFSVHIPYRSSAQGLPDFLAARVPLLFDTVVVSRGPATDGRARALAVTSAERSPVLPNVPTVRESGIPALRDFEASGWFGVYGPRGLPATQIQRLNTALNKVIGQADVQMALRQAGASVLGGTPEAFAQHNQREVVRWSALMARLAIKVD
jgi:tripartite-type tricarboxylate transporter receptor subunit TctC